jgi:hypothetical protein
VTIRSTDTVASAVQHLRDHRIEALPVVDDGRLIGIVTIRDLIGHPSYRPISEVMTREVVTVTVSEPVTTAFAVMESRGIGRLPVLNGDRVVGIITRSDLLRELGKLTDPLTELPWSGSLRQTAADLLKGGREIAIVFIDLDDFGRVNRSTATWSGTGSSKPLPPRWRHGSIPPWTSSAATGETSSRSSPRVA